MIPMELLLDHSDDGFDPSNMINHPDDDPIYAQDVQVINEHELVEVFGRPQFQDQLRAIISDFRDVFRSSLPAQPAKVKPLRIDINAEAWHSSANQAPHRRQSVSKDIEIFTQVKEMLASHVVEESTEACAWSQVLLTLKPNWKWRFCIDFRQLNQLVKDRGWPLPRIDEVIDRVGQKHPNFFGKMDLTNGYHQMPMAKESQKWTAFKTQWDSRMLPHISNNVWQQKSSTALLITIVSCISTIY